MSLISHFYGDPHFGHAGVIQYSNRPFADVEEMDRELERRYCEAINDDDVVVWTGDVSFHTFEWTRDLLSRLPGSKILVRGNHDSSVNACLRMGFSIVVETMYVSLLGYKTTVCHYPPAGTSKDPRFEKLRPLKPRKGEFLIHGHTHEKEKWFGRRIHVGVDAWDFSPAPMYAIIEHVADIANREG